MFSQLLVNALIAASIYLVVAAGISLAYSVTRFFHFAHAAVIACGAYSVFVLHVWVGLPLSISALIAAPLGGAVGLALELLIYRPLRRKAAGPLVLLLASIGAYVVLQNVMSLAFGDASRSIRPTSVQEGLPFLGARITCVQLISIAVALALLIILLTAFVRTRWGKMARAVMSDPELASVSGINVDGVILWVSFVASMLAATGGILQSLDVDMTPTMGMTALLAGVVAAVVGGIGRLPGVVLGAIFLALAQHLSTWIISTQWQDAIAFAILLAFLIFRPEGFMGKKVRETTV
ncbi:MAG: branched-chain amino acid ABC transporter permease [Candidatus Nealsonbacteria bacterium]|nr:branched-chain amino acid ABC transporter permease [Candidatus Nealsonbacteria bacterium]